jgi:hypothetical protein
MTITKMTVKIVEKQFVDFERLIDRCFLKRDAFLNDVLKTEAKNLAADLEGLEQSPRARSYVASELKRLGTRSVNIVVEKSTAEALNAVIERHNVSRDAFFNRLILFLRSSDALLEYLGLPRRTDDRVFARGGGIPQSATSPMAAIGEVIADPMFYLRNACEEMHEMGLYRLPIPRPLIGYNCYLPDADVPGTDDYERRRKEELESWGDLLEEEENVAFKTKLRARK